MYRLSYIATFALSLSLSLSISLMFSIYVLGGPRWPDSYVVSCQVFGNMQRSEKREDQEKAEHIKMLARMFPGLRIAYVDEDKDKGEFFSVLSKNAGDGTDNMVEEYRIKVGYQVLLFRMCAIVTATCHIIVVSMHCRLHCLLYILVS